MKKKFALILIAVMAVVMAAGCSPNEDDTANQTEPSTTAETTAKATDQQNGDQQKLIGEDKAREIVLKKVKGAKDSDITQFKQDKDDGREQYEGKIVYNGKEYEFDIDAVSGDVLKWEEETVNK